MQQMTVHIDDRGKSFHVDCTLYDHTASFIFDTGADITSITFWDALAAGLIDHAPIGAKPGPNVGKDIRIANTMGVGGADTGILMTVPKLNVGGIEIEDA